MKRAEIVGLVIVVLFSVILSVSSLNLGHEWGDDFASYIMQAQSLLNGSTNEFMQRNAFTIRESYYPLGPIAYPWGYPALLVPVLAITGLNLLSLKLINTFLYAVFLIVFYNLARTRLGIKWSLLATSLLAINPSLLYAHNSITSDIPFLFFSTLMLFLIDRWTWPGKKKLSLHFSLILGAVAFSAFSIRINGLLLLIPLILAYYMRLDSFEQIRKNWGMCILPFITFGILAGLLWALLPNSQGSYLNLYSNLTGTGLLNNLYYYLNMPAEMFQQIPVAKYVITVLFCVGMGGGAKRRENLPILAYMGITLFLFITWPERQGIRFVFPLLPIFVLIAAQGSFWLISKLDDRGFTNIIFGLWVSFIVIGLFSTTWSSWQNLNAKRAIAGPFDPASAEMFKFVREKTDPKGVVVFFKPRAMRLLTGRDSFMTKSCNDLSKVKYVVIHVQQGSDGQLTDHKLETCDVQPKIIFSNRLFNVYQIFP